MDIKRYARAGLRRITTSNRMALKAKRKNPRTPVHSATIKQELAEAQKIFEGYDRDHIWVFVSGHGSQDFRGNPKYLFTYINYYRPDIKAYWLCTNEETIEQVRKLGFLAYNEKTPAAHYILSKTGVMVAEQVKFVMPDYLDNIKYINLWHGIGFKHVERSQFKGEIAKDLACKYVLRGTFYRDHQMLNASCPTLEEEYATDIGVDTDKFLRTGYPRCLYQQNFKAIKTFDHDILRAKGLSKDTKLIVYAPTFRATSNGIIAKAIPDFEALYKLCEEKNLLFIFKMHPFMEKDLGFIQAKKEYGDRPHFLFWDNKDDFYEIMHTMDLAIVDYSGIISDMVSMGIKHYIRYTFDLDEYMSTVDIHDNYYQKTTGLFCYTFDELLVGIRTFEERDETEEIERLNNYLWSYSEGKDDFERIIKAAFDFKIEEREFPVLYSFDIFDTLISRKSLDPYGIFYKVMERIVSNGQFPYILSKSYPQIRQTAEFNVREYYNKSLVLRESEKTEVTLNEIIERISNVYNLSEEQTELLKKWEIEAEIEDVIPLNPQIDRIKELLSNNETVILISDMYLPIDVIKKMLRKADPILAELPLFLSNEFGVLKTSQKLFFEVYKSFKPYYDFKKWIHYGDNKNADQIQPRKFSICTRKINKPEFNDIQRAMVDYIGSYDAYLVAAAQTRLGEEHSFSSDRFVLSYISLCFVPYIDWVLRDAERRGYETLYFISRDGHHLKRIADAIIRERKLSIKTKYIYASRRTWRVPSFVDSIDSGFWEDYGSFGGITSKEKLLSALRLSEENFRKVFPYVDIDSIDFLNQKEFNGFKEIFKNSEDYRTYLLDFAAEERTLVNGYLKQEIDPKEKFAFVEYYGRGYTQDSFIDLWTELTGDKEADIPFYYCRSVLPSLGRATRYNFTTNNSKPYFIEAILANMPYKSIQKYKEENGKIVPAIEAIPYNEELFASMDTTLPLFAEMYSKLGLLHPEDTDRMLIDFVFKYFKDNQTNIDFAEQIGALIDSIALYGKKREFAPALTEEDLQRLEDKVIGRGNMTLTTNITMSVVRSDNDIQEKYKKMYQIMPGDELNQGELLSVKKQEKNEYYKKLYSDAIKKSKELQRVYDEVINNTYVDNSIVIIGGRKTSISVGLQMVRDALSKINEYNISVELFDPKNKKQHIRIIKKIATAKYVIIDQPLPILAGIRLRSETSLMLLPQDPFSIKGRARGREYGLSWENKYNEYVDNNNLTVIQVPSVFQETLFKRSYCYNDGTTHALLGSCATDVYYNKGYCNSSKKKLKKIFPESKGKKVILYMPTLRKMKNCKSWARLLDLEALKTLIGEEYVVAVHFNKSQAENLEFYNIVDVPGFSKDISKGINIRRLISAADIIVGDYRNSFFEATLLNKPMYSTADDGEAYLNEWEEAKDFMIDRTFCPVVRDAIDLAEELAKIEEYDFRKIRDFRETYLGGCDGKSVDRVIDFVIN